MKSRRRRSVGDLSTTMRLVVAGDVTLWIVYGALTTDAPLVGANIVTLVLAWRCSW